ncbi:sigma-54-dependent transcriptional regulator [Flavobacterium johnsoniae]|uniref:Two component, sigma54 specific, transcriptional regulator, Fis family n=1 Tax=Flavobacterium johnsoniae (strain ATCC 17061 / DSM 2064 / JCM 8514 / BCRC 14874 / CCUG 350202 / NBRC 14942 / NCIMB 11054 / UW101) TaxID=376686 RepID=A5FKA4_FLAJ1|nr:sigma-54 dependent transcriptional regulator [Flavobacterium johnsoniae]ABQ04364.1 two component, sigma54 specific, transcriptional regulator, Fis family [Flavobacterium johnsoniae UW101]OXE97692.1 sigma-54-dependent Fis family transcriptional regulator [Flavobacterium johnsoniae UW101]WQG83842.1 sigma-54 dependent transcriptional regulator [Flavobacterium johnsoniae UW101]SHK20310.1 DNA-binding transcriptional response regulator, NtrC family, contains REC, AAA-type ATPase, and a Fis-type DN
MRKKQAQILVVDDQEEILFSAKMILKKHFETIFTTNSPKKIISILNENEINVVLLDMNYRIGFEDGREGIHWLKEIKTLSPNTIVILMTAFGKIETAVEGIKIGAFDYVLKPWHNEKLLEIIDKAVAESRKNTKKVIAEKTEKRYFTGTSQKIKQAYSVAEKVARTDANVLILGENGTGKYVFAEFIHQNSERKNQPFVHVDLGSLSDNLFESELFGYAKGAFTDAKTDTPGRFETAQNGTIFLDEIGNIPLHLQAKLLHILQTKTLTRLGESKPRPLNVRVIAATNSDIKSEVKNKTFREDLLYRINTMEINLPPLRERKDDIVPMANFILENIAQKYNQENWRFDENVSPYLERYPWKGNVREMENKIERALILAENNTISVTDLDILDFEEIQENDDNPLSEMEKTAIEKALFKHHGNISKTAEELGLSRAALYRRIEKYDLKN